MLNMAVDSVGFIDILYIDKILCEFNFAVHHHLAFHMYLLL